MNGIYVILDLGIRQWPLSTALIYDAIMLLAWRLKSIGPEFLEIQYDQGIDCFDTQSNYKKGNTIENFIKAVAGGSNYTGLTGAFEFDSYGKRSNVAIDILNLDDEKGLKKSGSFQLSPANQTMRLTFLEKPKEEASDAIEAQTFNVVISLVCVCVYSKTLEKAPFSALIQHCLGFCLNFSFFHPGRSICYACRRVSHHSENILPID